MKKKYSLNTQYVGNYFILVLANRSNFFIMCYYCNLKYLLLKYRNIAFIFELGMSNIYMLINLQYASYLCSYFKLKIRLL